MHTEHVVFQGLLPPLRTVPSHGMSQSFQHASSWMGKGKRETAVSDRSWERHHPTAQTPPGAQPSSFSGLRSGRGLRYVHLLQPPPQQTQHLAHSTGEQSSGTEQPALSSTGTYISIRWQCQQICGHRGGPWSHFPWIPTTLLSPGLDMSRQPRHGWESSSYRCQ